jgi:hypothetical protein
MSVICIMLATVFFVFTQLVIQEERMQIVSCRSLSDILGSLTNVIRQGNYKSIKHGGTPRKAYCRLRYMGTETDALGSKTLQNIHT